jgi:hypothetical protein
MSGSAAASAVNTVQVLRVNRHGFKARALLASAIPLNSQQS